MEKYYRLLFIPTLIFLGCFLLTAYWSRYSTDDFEFLNKYHQLGFTGSINWFYHHWNTRWMAIGLLNLVFMVTGKTGSLFWYHAGSISLLWIAFFRLISNLKLFSFKYNLITASFAVVSFFYSCFSIPEVFFWINSSAFYLFGCIAFLFAIGELVNKQFSIVGWLLLLFSGLYIGGSYEPIAFTLMVATAALIIFEFRKLGPTAVKMPEVLKSIILLSVLMIAFAVSYAGEGHTIRASYLPQTTFGFKFLVMVKALIKMFGIYLPIKLLVASALALPWIFIVSEKPFNQLKYNSIYKITGIFIVLIFISLAPIVFIMSEMGPERAWTQISIYITLYAVYLATWLGTHYGEKFKFKNSIPVYIVFISISMLFFNISSLRKDIAYARAFDARMIFLQEQKVEGNKVEKSLEPLPETKWLHSSEISSDPNYFSNQQLKTNLKLDFEIRKTEVGEN